MPVNIEANVSLKVHTTLKVGGNAEFFCVISSEEELVEALKFAHQHELRTRVLGGGSNVLVPDGGVSGLVLKVSNSGISFNEVNDDVLVTAGAGVLFDELVEYTVERGLWGLENLSAIPGTVGATPIQNVGAYGIETGELIEEVRVFDTTDEQFKIFTAADCQFGYRDSRFKRESGRFIVTQVTYKLSRVPQPRVSYRDLATWFDSVATPGIADIRQAVIAIRSKKFPDWNVVGTAGSFFKNPMVSSEHAEVLRSRYPELPLYPNSDGLTKVALGWVIEHVLNKRGIRKGNIGTFEGQALVLVAYEGATAEEVSAFADALASDVFDATGISIEREVTTFGA